MSAPVLMAIFDLPWAPIFIFGIFLFHPVLGWLAVVGGAALVLIAGCHQLQVRSAQSVAACASGNADHLVDQFQQEVAVVRAVGLRPQAFAQWHEMALQGLRGQIEASDVSGGFAALSKALRLFLQSAMLGLGAYLVLQNQMTAGAMIASSILLGRALAPIDMLLGQWSQVQDALKSGRNLAALLEVVPAECARMALSRPAAKIVVKDLHVVPPGTKKASLRGVSFEVRPGQALGVIGSSGSGKSSLAQALTGLWPPAAGTLSLDRASFAQYGADDLASYVGYLPQRVPLFEGTIAQNIARLAAFPDEGPVIRAAKAAGAHDMILALPEGYDTALSYGRAPLSGGRYSKSASRGRSMLIRLWWCWMNRMPLWIMMLSSF